MAETHPSRVERRLAAIVAADVAGYSRLMGLDKVGTARTLREHRAVSDALVAKHGGRIVKTTGDGVLLEFASVVDAVIWKNFETANNSNGSIDGSAPFSGRL